MKPKGTNRETKEDPEKIQRERQTGEPTEETKGERENQARIPRERAQKANQGEETESGTRKDPGENH